MLLSVGKVERDSRDFGGAVPAGATQAALFAETEAAVAIQSPSACPGVRHTSGGRLLCGGSGKQHRSAVEGWCLRSKAAAAGD